MGEQILEQERGARLRCYMRKAVTGAVRTSLTFILDEDAFSLLEIAGLGNVCFKQSSVPYGVCYHESRPSEIKLTIDYQEKEHI